MSFVGEDVERVDGGAVSDVLEEFADFFAAQGEVIEVLDADPGGFEGVFVGVGFGGGVVDGACDEDHADTGAVWAGGVLEAQDAFDDHRDAGFFESLAPGCLDQGFAWFGASGWEIPELLMFALAYDQEAMPKTDDHEREEPGRDRRASHGKFVPSGVTEAQSLNLREKATSQEYKVTRGTASPSATSPSTPAYP